MMTWIIWKQFHSRRWTQVHATKDFTTSLCGRRINPYEYRHAEGGFANYPKCKKCLKASVITPEQRLENLSNVVARLATPSRRNVGKRPDNYAASKEEIASAALQLAEEVRAYLAGELGEIDSELPF